MKQTFPLLALLGCLALINPAYADAPRNGQVKNGKAWNETSQSWQEIEAFWQSYTNGNGGLTFAESSEYPPYRQVKEGDTFLVSVDSGRCLMEFFHSRWRRANDVRRWDPAFNDYGGCPDVFK